MSLIQQAQKAKEAGYVLGQASVNLRNSALAAVAENLDANKEALINANLIDMENAKNKGMTGPMLDRLMLNEQRINEIANAVRQIIALGDVLGEAESWTRPNGLVISRSRVPIGLIGIIYEARPNVTVDAAALCLKSGNAVILKGGSEAINTNLELVRLMKNALEKVGLPQNTIELVEDTSRETAVELMKLRGVIDILIPRGGAGLIKSVSENANIPVLFADAGNCHTYIDEFADIKMGVDILVNAKCSRPSVCNACETLLVHEKIAGKFLPLAQKALAAEGVELRGCEETTAVIKCKTAAELDYFTEYNDLILAVKVVKNIDEAIGHIAKYGTKHSECIVTNNIACSQKFSKMVDAAAVYVNASTRFTDGFEFGFGAEMGVSTQKLHARGPIGIRELTSYKYVVQGSGQIRG